MILGRVCGNITSTIAHPDMKNLKLLIIEKLDAEGKATDGYLIAVDSAGTGAGETVLVLDEGNGARQILGGENLPIRSVVVGVVDSL